jgi:TetR/AcrR family transcriptional regulator
MAPRGRSTSFARGARQKRAKGAQGPQAKGTPRSAPAPIAPMYKRLPHGPHRLQRNEVILHQRARIHGAMVEAVAQNGYEDTSVKQVIGLAGVSRRSFYEQFANKEECFLATFDLLARRELKQMRRAYLSTDGPLESRGRAVYTRFAQTVSLDRNAMVLVVLEAQSAGAAGVLRLRRATSACEQMLAYGYAETPGSQALPMPIVRGITGGLHRTVATFLRSTGNRESIDLADEMLRWTMLFQPTAAERMSKRMDAALNVRMREVASACGNGLGAAETASRDERTRILQGVLRLVTREAYHDLSAPQIADEANVPIDAFCELFDSRDECFVQALDMIGDELLEIAADPALVSVDWPTAVRAVLAELMRYLAEHPLHARTLVQEAFYASPEALGRTIELSNSIATLLTEGAPVRANGRLTIDAIAGAIWHTIRCQVTSGRIQTLAALSDHLAYVVLAPFIGADAAAEVVTEEREPRRASVVCGPRARQSA